MINRNAAILLTAATAFSCGFPGVAMMCLGNLSIINTQYPGQPPVDALKNLLLSGIFLWIGLTLFVIPVAVGVISFSLANKGDDQ